MSSARVFARSSPSMWRVASTLSGPQYSGSRTSAPTRPWAGCSAASLRLFGPVFTLPEPLIRSSGARIMGLNDPTVKMSKSLAGSRPGHAIGLLDPPSKVRKSVLRAVTDSGSEVDPEHLSPGVDNLLTLFETLTAASRDETLAKFAGQGYGTLKREVAEVAIETVGQIQGRYQLLRDDDSTLDSILTTGAERASRVAKRTLDAAMHAIGLR